MNLHRLTETFGDYAGFGPGVIISLILSLVACGYASRALKITRAHGWALLMSLGVVLSATMTPSREALLFGARGSGTCDLSRIALAPLQDLSHLNDTSLNILLFVPLGLAIALCPRSRAKYIVLAGAFVLPASIELIQLLVPRLGRECQSADVIDNLTGLVVGLAAGVVARLLASMLDRLLP
jgi:glycopeptide antibiotics resistance protein